MVRHARDWVRASLVAIALGQAAAVTAAEEAAEDAAEEAAAVAPTPARQFATPQFELKRAMTNRGSTEESTRTTLRAEVLLDAPVALLRLDVPYVDKNNDFVSDPLNAGLGDLKARVRLAPLPLPGPPLSPYTDVVFPTADGTLGGGKYQLAPGLSTSIPLPSPWSGAPALVFLPLVQQYLSVAGDPSRKDVNYTKLELKVEARWRDALLSLNPKPVYDWTQGKSAAVLELQGTWIFSAHWRAWLKAGRRLWGDDLPTTYDEQVEIGVRWRP